MGFFRAVHRWGGQEKRAWEGVLKVCQYLAIMKLDTVVPYLKKIQKTYKSCDTPLKFCWHQYIFTGFE